MALSNNTTQQAGTKLSIVGGKFTIRVNEGVEGAESRKLTKGKNEGKTVWELRYSTLEDVTLVGGVDVEGEYPGADVTFRDVASGDETVVNFPLDSGYLYEFIRALPNLDTSAQFNVEMRESKKKTKQGNPKYNLRLSQNGSLVDDFYVKWDKDESGKNIPTPMNGIPEPEKDARGWNWRPVEDFLLNKFQEFFGNFEASDPVAVITEAFAAEPELPPEDEVDIPF